VVLFRLSNTLDAMWGYRTERYHAFGWAAARLDDLLGWLPARLTALAYLLVGDAVRGWRCWHSQGDRSDSPNAGVVMASGAGALGLSLGGPTAYHGQLLEKPLLGEGLAPRGTDIERAVGLVQRALALWLALILLLGVLFG
jgi:adenosylcobinamide-phosphate synthase